MAFDIESGVVFNLIVWQTSPKPNETRMVQFMIFDVSAICASNQSPFQQYVAPSGAMLIEALAENREGGPPWLPTAALSHFLSRAWS